LAKQKQENNDLGLGTKITAKGKRMVKQDGSFNVERRGLPKFSFESLYHNLITMSWAKFNLLVLGLYAAINILFAALFFAVGVNELDGIASVSNGGKFLEVLYFSAQTFTTVGYGHISPVGYVSGFISSVESLFGLLSFALATGLLYGRFSRPQARIIFSHIAVIAPFQGASAFMFRLANRRSNQLIEAEIKITFAKTILENGQNKRFFTQLELERNQINFLPTSWTIVHPINENSPFYNVTKEELLAGEMEIIVLLKAFDDTFSQTVHARFSYRAEELIFGAKFSNIFGVNDDGITFIDLHRIDEVEHVELPVLV
jgi:inward rectifier potassium channel